MRNLEAGLCASIQELIICALYRCADFT